MSPADHVTASLEPRTEAGKALLAALPSDYAWDDPAFARFVAARILDIEDESRDEYAEATAAAMNHGAGFAEGLAEAKRRLAVAGFHDGRCPEPDTPCTCGLDTTIDNPDPVPWNKLEIEP